MGGFPDNKSDRYDLGQLPSIPHVILQLVDACHKSEVSFDELSEIVQRDVGLCAKVMAAVPGHRRVGTSGGDESFSRLLASLGVDAVRTIAITSAVNHFFSPFDEASGRRLGGLWRDSLFAAHSARLLARLSGYPRDEEAYLAGLLHSMGALLLQRGTARHADPNGGGLSAIELDDREITGYGITACELAANIAREWRGAPFLLADALRYQRAPVDTILDAPRLVRLVNFARALSRRPVVDESLVAQAEQLFELSATALENLLAEVRESVAAAAASVGLACDWSQECAPAIIADDEAVRLRLARKVREFALLDGIQRHLASGGDLDEVLQTCLQDLELLFGLGRGICFLCDDAEESLSAVFSNCGDRARIEEFELKLRHGRSLVAEAVMRRQVISTFDADVAQRLAVVDRQLLEMLAAEGMVCIPLNVGAQDVGVITAGVSRFELQRLTQAGDFLRCFAETLAGGVLQHQQLSRSREEALQQERELKQTQIRKLVHEANNPLAIIKNYLQVLSIKLGDEGGVQDQLAILSEEIERVAGIIQRMRDVTPSNDVAQGVVDINELIHDLLGVFRISHFVTRGIRADVRLDASLPPLLTNRNSLKQVLTNLIKNAVEAMPDGGQIRISSRDRVNVDGIQYVELRLADSGPGIPEEVLDNLFRPVKSAKGRGHSGLGLTIVKNLVADIDGSISCSNGAESGAEFIIHLPRNVENR